jgi:microcystin-dependent protein
MSCSNCFNGCSQITSDQCVKYTGINIPVLGIQTGDSLSYVEQALIEFLVSTLNGTGIKIDIAPSILCELVSSNLPTCGDLTAVDLFNALIKSVCSLQEQSTTLTGRVDAIESPYSVECLDGVTSSSNTHDILQAVIIKLCQVDESFTTLAANIPVLYVSKAELCTLVTACIQQNTPSSNLQYLKMVPNTVVEYYGSLDPFDSTGKGSGDWINIYLCNGQNGTPDKRGRVPVGAIQDVPGGTLDVQVAPGGYNPNYAIYTKAGTNSVTLVVNQIPSHTHIASVTDNGHSHTVTIPSRDFVNEAGTSGPDLTGSDGGAASTRTFSTAPNTTGITVSNTSVGEGLAHANNQPAIACYYIMYIPA